MFSHGPTSTSAQTLKHTHVYIFSSHESGSLYSVYHIPHHWTDSVTLQCCGRNSKGIPIVGGSTGKVQSKYRVRKTSEDTVLGPR